MPLGMLRCENAIPGRPNSARAGMKDTLNAWRDRSDIFILSQSVIDTQEPFESLWLENYSLTQRESAAKNRANLAAPQPEGTARAVYGRDIRCTHCGFQPDGRAHWNCRACQKPRDRFAASTTSTCEACTTAAPIECPRCGESSAHAGWVSA